STLRALGSLSASGSLSALRALGTYANTASQFMQCILSSSKTNLARQSHHARLEHPERLASQWRHEHLERPALLEHLESLGLLERQWFLERPASLGHLRKHSIPVHAMHSVFSETNLARQSHHARLEHPERLASQWRHEHLERPALLEHLESLGLLERQWFLERPASLGHLRKHSIPVHAMHSVFSETNLARQSHHARLEHPERLASLGLLERQWFLERPASLGHLRKHSIPVHAMHSVFCETNLARQSHHARLEHPERLASQWRHEHLERPALLEHLESLGLLERQWFRERPASLGHLRKHSIPVHAMHSVFSETNLARQSHHARLEHPERLASQWRHEHLERPALLEHLESLGLLERQWFLERPASLGHLRKHSIPVHAMHSVFSETNLARQAHHSTLD